jgi:hypothetical protein
VSPTRTQIMMRSSSSAVGVSFALGLILTAVLSQTKNVEAWNAAPRSLRTDLTNLKKLDDGYHHLIRRRAAARDDDSNNSNTNSKTWDSVGTMAASSSATTTRPVPIAAPSAQQIQAANEVAARFQVQPGSRLPRSFWRWSWKWHYKCLPLLHFGDSARAKDLDKSLRCLWCKAIAARNTASPVYDRGMTYDMLPRPGRWIVKLPNRLFPRLIHSNIELRTAYLDTFLREELHSAKSAWDAYSQNTTELGCDPKHMKVRLITLGAGYDARSVRMLTEGLVDEAWELDIETVAASKHVMLQRLRRRRHCALPTVIPTNLNDLEAFEKTLQGILYGRNDTSSNERDIDDSYTAPWYTIFLTEGVMIYLDEGIPTKMLSICSKLAKQQQQQQSGSGGATLLFTDLLRNVSSDDHAPGKERDDAKVELQNSGWDLLESSWYVKPGLAKHMGTARLTQ